MTVTQKAGNNTLVTRHYEEDGQEIYDFVSLNGKAYEDFTNEDYEIIEDNTWT